MRGNDLWKRRVDGQPLLLNVNGQRVLVKFRRNKGRRQWEYTVLKRWLAESPLTKGGDTQK